MATPSMSTPHNRFQSSVVLAEKLAAVLPKGYKFGIYHLSTPPTKTDALFQAPPGDRLDRTYRESHFLSVTIDAPSPQGDSAAVDGCLSCKPQLLVFALEIFIFTTAYTSTFFVSKADSSGYLHLLKLPKGTPSPIREVCTTFLEYLVEQRRRTNIQSVVSLFARAQSQYLFPCSVENSGKHVLDDRGLVKWWCRVLDPLLRDQTAGTGATSSWRDVKAYLIVPGLDSYETRAFIPRAPAAAARWTVGHPLERISHYYQEHGSVPARYLVPQYPDDPKSRFRDELDEEAERSEQSNGAWKSVKTMDQFWDMMAYRQECSSGRMTGFIWVVFDPAETASKDASVETPTASQLSTSSEKDETQTASGSSESKKSKPKKTMLKGPIISRLPRIKTEQRNYLVDRLESTAYYYWPPEGRGKHLVDDSDYKRTVELLLQLDFSTLEKSVISTARWIKEGGVGNDWRLEVVGQRAVVAAPAALPSNGSGTNDLSGLVKRKRAPTESVGSANNGNAPAGQVNVLSSGLVRKKRKENEETSGNGTASGEAKVAPVQETAPRVNVLSAGLVRKKPKAA